VKWRFFANPIAGGAEPDHNVVVNMLRLVTTVPLLLVMCPHLLTGQTNSLVLKTTVCAVADKPSAFDGTLVQIEATYAGSFEGSYLSDPTCGKSVWFTTPDGVPSLAAIVVSGSSPQVAKPKFDLVRDKEYKKFAAFAYAMGPLLLPEYTVKATFVGRIDRCRHFKINDRGFGNGFGQMGLSEFQFVLRSVSSVSAEEFYLVAPTRSVLTDHISEN
jgi:hypothetical protein